VIEVLHVRAMTRTHRRQRDLMQWLREKRMVDACDASMRWRERKATT